MRIELRLAKFYKYLSPHNSYMDPSNLTIEIANVLGPTVQNVVGAISYLVGGIFGTVFGVFVAFLVGVGAKYAGAPGMFSFGSLDYLGFLAVLLVTFIIGVLSGVLPARQAAKMEPAEALRYE